MDIFESVNERGNIDFEMGDELIMLGYVKCYL